MLKQRRLFDYLKSIISRLRCMSGCCLPRRSPNSVTKAGSGGRVACNLLVVVAVPAHGVAEAAHYLLVPRATLRAWLARTSYGSDSERRLPNPLIQPAAMSPIA